MSRPTFPRCVLPANCIRDIVARQKLYDEDPAGYERREQEKKEQREREEWEEQQSYADHLEAIKRD